MPLDLDHCLPLALGGECSSIGLAPQVAIVPLNNLSLNNLIPRSCLHFRARYWKVLKSVESQG